MENTQELEIDIDDIGAILKSNRLKQKKSLEDVSAELCIRKIYLTALEEGDYETLPPVPYGVGYVRTYANYLGLSSERAVKLYKKASLIEEESKVEEISIEPEINKSNTKHIFLGVIALLLVYGLWQLYSKTSTKITPAVEEIAEKESQINSSAIEDVLVNNEVVVDTSSAIEDVENKANIENDIIEEKEIETENKEEETINDNKLKIKFNGESWVEIKDKNKVYFQGVYHQGDIKEVEYVDNLFISVGRPKNVEVFVKGVKKNLLAKRRKTNILVDSLE